MGQWPVWPATSETWSGSPPTGCDCLAPRWLRRVATPAMARPRPIGRRRSGRMKRTKRLPRERARSSTKATRRLAWTSATMRTPQGWRTMRRASARWLTLRRAWAGWRTQRRARALPRVLPRGQARSLTQGPARMLGQRVGTRSRAPTPSAPRTSGSRAPTRCGRPRICRGAHCRWDPRTTGRPNCGRQRAIQLQQVRPVRAWPVMPVQDPQHRLDLLGGRHQRRRD